MDEGIYLELVTQLKAKFDENERKVKKIQRQTISLKKDIMMAYSLVRIMDEPNFVDANDYRVFIELLRGHLSHVVENKIMCQCSTCKPPESEDEEDILVEVPITQVA